MKKKIWRWRNVINKSREATRLLYPFALSASLCASPRKRLLTKIAHDFDSGLKEFRQTALPCHHSQVVATDLQLNSVPTLVWEIPGDHWY